MNKCKEYHDWVIISVNGTLPNQELELECKKCGETDYVAFEHR